MVNGDFFLDEKSVVRQLEFVYTDVQPETRVLLDTKEVTFGSERLGEATFAFKAPEGSRELTKEEMLSDKWYTDLDEAKKVANDTKRILMVDFYADW